MSPVLLLATAASFGWGDAAELRRIEPNDLLAAAFVARLSIDAELSLAPASAESVALEIWYPPVPAVRVLDVAGPSSIDARRDVRYDLRLPFFRSKP